MIWTWPGWIVYGLLYILLPRGMLLRVKAAKIWCRLGVHDFDFHGWCRRPRCLVNEFGREA